MFDIDGVIVRGKNVLPSAPEAFSLLYNKEQERWRVPSIFVTNAGNTLRQEKADKLSDWLQVPVTEDQVVMSHSPLKMFTEYHSKHVLVMGQGAVHHIASSLGFTNVTTMDELRHAFPALDAVDHKRRRAAPCAFNKYFPRIEAVIMFGEPVRWETSLQVSSFTFLSASSNILDNFYESNTDAAAAGRADDGRSPLCGPGCHTPATPTNTRLQYGPAVDGRGTHGRLDFSELGGKNTDYFISLTLVFFSAKIWSWSLPAVC